MCEDSEKIYVQLLGPLSARFGDEVVTPTASKQRQVLALLALRARQVITISTFIEELWAGHPPRSYAATVQTYVFQVRRRLAAALPAERDIRQILSTRHSGYLLECRTDIDAVQRLASAGRAAAEAGNPRSASDLLGRALALWRGPALADVHHGPVCEIEAAALAQTRLSLLERRIESDLAIHRYADVIGELTSLVAEHPTNERFCGLLMRALYHSGYTARALKVFRQLRASLNRELGVEPSPPLQELHRAILSGDLAADIGGPPGKAPQARHGTINLRKKTRVRKSRNILRFRCRVAQFYPIYDKNGHPALPGAPMRPAASSNRGISVVGRRARPRDQNTTEKISSGEKRRDVAVGARLYKKSGRVIQYDWGRSYVILLTSLSGVFAIQVISIIKIATHPLPLAFALASATAVFALQLRNCSPDAQRWPPLQRGAMVLGQGVATYLPLLALHILWTGMTGFLAGSMLLLMPGWKAWVPFTAIALSMLAAAMVMREGTGDIALIAIGEPAFGIVVFGLCRLTLLVRYGQARHAEIAQLAIIRERTRFSRDLHDLLGYSLSAIALKAELGRRIMDTKPDLAREELADVVVFARQAVADVRLVADGYRAMSLAAEASSAASLLASLGIMAEIEIDCGGLDNEVDTVLATVLREALTNLLRHSAARTCQVTASQAGDSVTLLVANDGVPKSGVTYRSGGGLESLGARLETVGGTLTVESQNDTFCLFAAVPHTARRLPGMPDSAAGN